MQTPSIDRGKSDSSGQDQRIRAKTPRVRWRFIDSEAVLENLLRRDLRATIDVAWLEIMPRLREIVADGSGETAAHASEQLSSALASLDADLSWEFHRGRAGKPPRLIISAGEKRRLDPLVSEFLGRAPDLDSWRLHCWRPAVSIHEVEAMVALRVGFVLDTNVCGATRDASGSLVVTLPSGAIPVESPAEALRIARDAVRKCLGEEVYFRWVSAVRLGEVAPESAFSMSDLPAVVAHSVEEWTASLPEHPLFRLTESLRWQTLDRSAARAHVGPGRSDLIVLTTIHHPFVTGSREEPSFWSRNYSRHGERFLYLKIAKSEAEPFDHEGFEADLASQLLQEHVGCVVGSGFGLAHTYHDLAVTDVDRAVAVTRAVAEAHQVPKRAWVQFFDSSWAHEWVGLHPESPAPILIDS